MNVSLVMSVAARINAARFAPPVPPKRNAPPTAHAVTEPVKDAMTAVINARICVPNARLRPVPQARIVIICAAPVM